MPRTVTLELVDSAGLPLGTLPPYDVESRWWADTGPAVQRAYELYRVDVRVLHLLDGTAVAGTHTVGGTVRYLAELIAGEIAGVGVGAGVGRPEPEDPNRPLWARPGGAARIIDWADAALRSNGRPRIGPVHQLRAWNLSGILRFDTAAGPVWCKSVPPFFAHEGASIEWLGAIAPPGLLPRLLARQDGTILLDDIPGEDLYNCAEPIARTMVDRLVELQYRTIGLVTQLQAIGLPDWRADQLTTAARALRGTPGLTPAELAALEQLLAVLPTRYAELAACGIPDTLVHGDPHPGNWRSDGESLVLLDWGDCGVGHPLLDTAAFVERINDNQLRSRLLDAFVSAWRNRLPGADPAGALRIIGPIAALRQALIYQTFLDNIETAERVYHRASVASWIRRAIG